MSTKYKSIFYPKSIAVVGVSSDPQKLGSVIFNNILRFGYSGNLYPVNPKYTSLYGKEVFSSVSKISEDIDLAVLVVPSEFVYDVIKDCAKKGVEGVIIITAGFKEIGVEGAKLERKVVDYAKKHGISIVGPNCLGIISTPSDLNASFAPQQPGKGNIAFLSQSGAFNSAMLDLAVDKLLGFRYFVSLGNKSDVDELILLKEWYSEDDVEVLGAYLEQFEDGKEMIDLVSRNRNKPLILLNSGISEAGKRAASSHTGSLAGSARSIKTALKQAGVIQVDSIEKMYSNLMLFSWCPRPSGNRVAIITNAGGPGIIITDTLSEAGLEIAELSAKSKKSLDKFLPPTASTNNPVDILGDSLAERYEKALQVVTEDPNVDIIILLLTPQLITQVEETAKVAIDFYQKYDKPLVPVFIGEKYVQPGLSRMWENKVPAFQYDEEAVAAIKNLVHYSTVIQHKKYIKTPSLSSQKHKSAVKMEIDKKAEAIPPELARRITLEAGIDTPTEAIGTTYEDLLEYFNYGDFPVVLKATTEDVAHKTEEKVIFLDIYTERDLRVAFNQLSTTLRTLTKKDNPSILIQEQILGKEELILGVNYDPDFGHILLFGKGGIYTEVYNDTSTRMVYAGPDEIGQMIAETSVSKILDGARGLEKLPTDKIIGTLEALQRIVLRYPDIRSIDINPAMITVNRCIAVDVKLFI